MRKKLFIILFLIFTQTSFADEVIFKNGDKLTGTIKEFKNHQLIFDSQVAGSLTIDTQKIHTFKTDEPVEIALSDGRTFNQVVLASGPGFFAVNIEPNQHHEIAFENVTSIDRTKTTGVKWSGEISAGFAASRGNTVADSGNFNFNISRRTARDRTLFSGYYLKGEQQDPDTKEKITTQDSWWMRGRYDYFFTKKLYGYGDARYEHDAIADLDSRTIVGGGIGRQWIESENLNFSTDIGLASVKERYNNQSEDGSGISGQLGYHLDKKINSKVKFINDLTYYPRLEQFSDYLLTSAAEIRTSITERIFTNFKVIFDYDATPAEKSSDTDIKYIFGIGINF